MIQLIVIMEKNIYRSEYFSDLSLKKTSQSRKANELSCAIHPAYHAKMPVFLSLANSLSSDSYFHVFKQGKSFQAASNTN